MGIERNFIYVAKGLKLEALGGGNYAIYYLNKDKTLVRAKIRGEIPERKIGGNGYRKNLAEMLQTKGMPPFLIPKVIAKLERYNKENVDEGMWEEEI